MPSGATDFRPVCGCFLSIFINFMLKRALFKKAMRASVIRLKSRLDGVVFALLLSYMFWGSQLLLRCGDIESNPGPPPDTRQSRLSCAGGSMGKLIAGDKGADAGGAKKQPTNADIMGSLLDLTSRMETNFRRVDSKCDEVKDEMQQLRQEYSELKDEVKDLREEVSQLKERNDFLERTNVDLHEACNSLSRKTDDLENRSKRNNLIFFGLGRSDNETNEDCENILQDLFTDTLELAEDVELDRAHRLNSDKNSPIIARCVKYKQKQMVLKARGKLKGSDVFVSEDFSKRVRDVRKRLTPHLKTCKREGKQATIVYDYLLVDGRRYVVNENDDLVAFER